MLIQKFSAKKIVTLSVLAALGIPLMFIEVAPVPIAPWLKFDFSDIVVYIAAVIYGPAGAVLVALIKSIIHFLIKGSVAGIPIDQFIAFVSSLAYVLPFYFTMVFIRKIIKQESKIMKYISLAFGLLFITLSVSYIGSLWVRYIMTQQLSIALSENFDTWFIILLLPFVFVLISIIVLLLLKVYPIKDALIIRIIPMLAGTLSLTVLLTFLNYIWFTPWYLSLIGLELPEPFLKYVVSSYAPFNFAKGVVLSAVFLLFSFRIDQVAKGLKICDDESSLFSLED